MALKDADLFVVLDSADSQNKKVRADALTTFVTGGANVQSVTGGAGVEALTTDGAVTVSADININRGLEFTGAGDDRELAVKIGDGLRFDANGAVEVTTHALNFVGNVDLTNFATLPAGAVEVGDTFVNTGDGTAVADWAATVDALAAGDVVEPNDLIICNTAGTGVAAQYTFVAAGGNGGLTEVNLAQGTRTAVEVPITNDAGDDATLTAATTTLAGVMTAADKTKLDQVTTGDDGSGNDIVTNIKVDLSRARDAVSNTVECDKGENATLTAAEPSSNGTGGFAGLLTATDKEKLDELGAGATIVSVTAQNGVQNTGTPTEPVLEAVFGAVAAGKTATTVMPYDISILDPI